MAINVNGVYRVVLSILNKESRGYLTPDQFNRFARKAQLDLLDKSFYDYNRFLNRKKTMGVNSEYGDIATNIKEKIDALSVSQTVSVDASTGAIGETSAGLYKVIDVNSTARNKQIQEVTKNELSYLNSSKLTAPSSDFPVYYRVANSMFLLPKNSYGSLNIDFIKVPSDPIWGFTGGGSSAYAYNSSSSTNFDLHPSEEVPLIIKILAYAGVMLKDPLVIQTATSKETNDFNTENLV
tara:strand:- start:437 stop:1150 length:714 start_codon:yes stop_codon:yes gene_type:complete